MMLASWRRKDAARGVLAALLFCGLTSAARADGPDPSLDEGAQPQVEAAGAVQQSPASENTPAADGNAGEKSLGPRERPKLDAASFKGIQPGRSTLEELTKAWGEPLESQDDGGATVQSYKVESFERVQATIVDGVVSSIVIYLGRPFPADVLAEQLELDEIPLVEVKDEAGQPLGQAFPERGVMFGYAADAKTPQVSQVLLEPVDAQAFLLRAQATADTDSAGSLADVQCAIDLEPSSAPAHRLKAELLFEQGEIQAALKHAQEAVSFDNDEACRLTLAKVLAAGADYTQAAQINQQLLDAEIGTPLVRARAAVQLGTCLATGPNHDYQQAASFQIKAIKMAGPLAAGAKEQDHRQAKQILLDAHLQLAHDIAWGAWQRKEAAVPKWLARAKEIATDLATKEGVGDEALRKLNFASLEILAGMPKPPDSSEHTDASLRLGKAAIDACRDPAARARLQWELGTALVHAAQIEHAREKDDNAMAYASMAVDLLQEGRVAGERVPGHEQILGGVYYQIGAIHAVARKDHKQAVTWYQRAVPLLERPAPPGMSNPAQQAEAFISMAVSFWDQANRKEAMRLTLQGTQLMEKAVEDGRLPESALSVPYGNLSSMHQELGETEPAKKYAELAGKSEQAGSQKQ